MSIIPFIKQDIYNKFKIICHTDTKFRRKIK